MWSLRQESIVDVTPRPVLTGLDRGHDRVAGGVEVLRRMSIRRRVTASHVPAREALPEVDPFTADLQAIHAAGGRPPHVTDRRLLEVLARCTDIDVARGFHRARTVAQIGPTYDGSV